MFCGTEIKEDQRSCPKCGNELVNKNKNSAKYTSNKKKTHAVIACVCCFAVLISSIIGEVIWNKKNNSQINEADKTYTYYDNCFSDIKITDANSALEAISDVKGSLGLIDVNKELKLESENTIDGNTYYRFQQYYNEIPVYGNSVIVLADKSSNASALTSNFSVVDTIDFEDDVSYETIKENIKNYINKNIGAQFSVTYINQIESSDKCIYFFNNTYYYSIVFEVCLNDWFNYKVFVNANNNEIINMICLDDSDFETASFEGTSGKHSIDYYHLDNNDDFYQGMVQANRTDAFDDNDNYFANDKKIYLYSLSDHKKYFIFDKYKFSNTLKGWKNEDTPTKVDVETFHNVCRAYDFYNDLLNHKSTDGKGIYEIIIGTGFKYIENDGHLAIAENNAFSDTSIKDSATLFRFGVAENDISDPLGCVLE